MELRRKEPSENENGDEERRGEEGICRYPDIIDKRFHQFTVCIFTSLQLLHNGRNHLKRFIIIIITSVPTHTHVEHARITPIY